MKILDGRELAGFVKERQAKIVRALNFSPKLLILRDSDNPVITKYVRLKQHYGEDIGIEVEDFCAKNSAELLAKIQSANRDSEIDAMIVQLPIKDAEKTSEILGQIAPEKDVDGLSHQGDYDSATATAINWLLSGYDLRLMGRKIAIVGQGRLVGEPLAKMWRNSGLDVTTFHKGDDLAKLRDYGVVVTATGVPHLVKTEMLSEGAVVIDAGTASEDGVLVGDLDEAARARTDFTAITPKVGGVGPLTVAVLFDNVINAASKR